MTLEYPTDRLLETAQASLDFWRDRNLDQDLPVGLTAKALCDRAIAVLEAGCFGDEKLPGLYAGVFREGAENSLAGKEPPFKLVGELQSPKLGDWHFFLTNPDGGIESQTLSEEWVALLQRNFPIYGVSQLPFEAYMSIQGTSPESSLHQKGAISLVTRGDSLALARYNGTRVMVNDLPSIELPQPADRRYGASPFYVARPTRVESLRD